MVVVYIVGTTAYTSGFKREPVMDVFVLGALYMLRLAAGGEATSAPLSPWFLAFSGLFFLSLALAKRHTELRKQLDQGETPGRGYRPSDWALHPFRRSRGGHGRGRGVFALRGLERRLRRPNTRRVGAVGDRRGHVGVDLQTVVHRAARRARL